MNIPNISHDKIDPTWSTFLETGTNDVRDLPENPPLQTSVLSPPRVFTLQTNGDFNKIEVPGLSKIILADIELVSDDEEGSALRRESRRREREEKEEEKKEEAKTEMVMPSLMGEGLGGFGGFSEGDGGEDDF